VINWLASYPKSGNTWVRFLLAAYFEDGHLDINCVPWGAGDNRKYVYQTVSPLPLDKLTNDDVINLRPAALMHLISSVAQKPLMVKTHHFYGQINDIHLFPNVLSKRAFYIVRDPRAVVCSFANHMKFTIDHTIDKMNQETFIIKEDDSLFHALSTWSLHVEGWLNDKSFPVHLVRYEKLLETPNEVLSNILEKIGFKDISPERIDRAVKATQFSELAKQEEQKGFEEAPEGITFFRKAREDWQSILTEAQINRIESDHGKMMEKLGYATTTL
jgi:hypothetical protein